VKARYIDMVMPDDPGGTVSLRDDTGLIVVVRGGLVGCRYGMGILVSGELVVDAPCSVVMYDIEPGGRDVVVAEVRPTVVAA
jgi:hypothetical protein